MTSQSRKETLAVGSPLTAVRGIGPVRAQQLAARGFRVVEDLLFLLPFRYEDRRLLSDIEDLEVEGLHTFRGRLRGLKPLRTRRRGLSIVRGSLVTQTAQMPVVWFNRPYIASQIDPEVEYLLHGLVRNRKETRELVNPSVEIANKARLGGNVVPIYPSAGSLAPSQVRTLMNNLLDGLDPCRIEDALPRVLLERHQLPVVGRALARLHRPDESTDIEELNGFRSPEHRRLIYGELLRMQLELALARREVVRQRKRHSYTAAEQEFESALKERLPFDLTAAQERAVSEIIDDLRSPYPMMRLLQGDVGCGKTAVAAMALAMAVASGLQAALMAPTELLAEQHYAALVRLLGDGHPTVLLTSSTEGAAKSRELLSSGAPCVAVGTHALIQDRVRFDNLGLVIVDEQQRFGVSQRRELQLKGARPDLLVMTATPIPRSLTLTVYGDLALSVIDELPPGRSPVTTTLVSRKRRHEIYEWLEKELEGDVQAYVVFPLIGESDALDAESVQGLGQRLADRFAHFGSATLHGGTPPERRLGVMADFAAGRLKVLIATTVIEVGVDVPQAAIMIIESAERFGLSQLHQLRGRVGRGDQRSYCFAIHGSGTEESLRRLQIFADTSDGFRIAEEDLALRGPGDVLGTRQSGLPTFRIANLARDGLWIERARSDAADLVASDPAAAKRLAAQLGAVGGHEPLAGA